MKPTSQPQRSPETEITYNTMTRWGATLLGFNLLLGLTLLYAPVREWLLTLSAGQGRLILPATSWLQHDWFVKSLWFINLYLAVALISLLLSDRNLLPDNKRLSAQFTPAATALLIWLLDGRNLLDSFFQFDDFEIFTSRHGETFWSYLALPHGPTAIPMLRLEIWTLTTLFGVNPLPYMILNLMFLIALITLAARLCSFYGLSAFQQSAIIFFLAVWMPWGEFTAGYFTISIYMQVIICFFGAAFGAMMWIQQRRFCGLILVALCPLLAVLLHLSGFWVAPVALWIAWERDMHRHPHATVRQSFQRLWPLLITAVASLMAYLLLTHMLGLSVTAATTVRQEVPVTPHYILGAQGMILIHGLIQSIAFPGMISYLQQYALEWLVWIPTLCVGGVFLLLALRGSRDDRRWLMMWGLVLFGLLAVPPLGRQFSNPYMFLQGKYLIYPFVWLALMIAIALARLYAPLTAKQKGRVYGVFVWLVVTYATLQLLASSAGGHTGNDIRLVRGERYREAKDRQEACEALARAVQQITEAAIGTDAHTLPNLGPLGHVFPSLGPYQLCDVHDFIGGAQHNLTYIVPPTAEVRYPALVRSAPDWRDQIPAKTMDALQADPLFKQLLNATPWAQSAD